ncbi:small, acid-soluble spore protein D [Clostridium acetireducens DSM 10703]|jgi:small acid-soluble spore protein D (minor alpha/beta-type SASP)|uniref:Small, acid-soluble spore protein D n=1 Tax=Clostridium acetireducens DSM 10703 TaxID=1121290 RepID=A0A1E8EYH4_9CLOT|nr:alpha/beta-type small acid-soluble spore protein [Clostridium acetireducens]OFI06048.1 small, acid-soluble spore protein D [Clostridium acetireducens DSM 10703]
MSRKRPLVPGVEKELDKFKMEVASEMGLEDKFNSPKPKNRPYMGNLPSNMVNKIVNSGNVGGEMVRRMVEEAEKNLINKNK